MAGGFVTDVHADDLRSLLERRPAEKTGGR